MRSKKEGQNMNEYTGIRGDKYDSFCNSRFLFTSFLHRGENFDFAFRF